MDAMKIRTFTPALEGFLDTIRDGHTTTPIVVISPITFPILENSPGPLLFVEDKPGMISVPPPRELNISHEWDSLTIGKVRELIAAVVERRSKEDSNLYCLDGLRLFGADDVLYDGIHPDGEGYLTIGRRFCEELFGAERRMLQLGAHETAQA
jgi:hypothetical protein